MKDIDFTQTCAVSHGYVCISRLFAYIRKWSILTFSKMGLIVYCGLMTAIMVKHGGVHIWDLTIPEVRTIVYVSYIS